MSISYISSITRFLRTYHKICTVLAIHNISYCNLVINELLLMVLSTIGKETNNIDDQPSDIWQAQVFLNKQEIMEKILR